MLTHTVALYVYCSENDFSRSYFDNNGLDFVNNVNAH